MFRCLWGSFFGLLGLFWASWGPLGASFGPLLGLLGPLESLLDASWRHLGLRRRPKVRRINVGNRFWVDFGSFLVPFGGHFGSFRVSFLDIAVWCALGGEIWTPRVDFGTEKGRQVM